MKYNGENFVFIDRRYRLSLQKQAKFLNLSEEDFMSVLSDCLYVDEKVINPTIKDLKLDSRKLKESGMSEEEILSVVKFLEICWKSTL